METSNKSQISANTVSPSTLSSSASSMDSIGLDWVATCCAEMLTDNCNGLDWIGRSPTASLPYLLTCLPPCSFTSLLPSVTPYSKAQTLPPWRRHEMGHHGSPQTHTTHIGSQSELMGTADNVTNMQTKCQPTVLAESGSVAVGNVAPARTSGR